MRKIPVIAIAFALFAFVGCETQQTDTEIGEGAAEVEQETEESIEEAGDYFSQWDMDQQQGLNQDEFTTGLQDQGTFGDWDADGDGMIDQQDFQNAFGDADWYDEGLFNEWDMDGDGNLMEEEVSQGLFEEWDENGDGVLTQDEFHDDFF